MRCICARCLKTVFGPVRIARLGYPRLGAPSIHPLDQALQLPARRFSRELQKRMVKASVQGPFEEAAERIQEFTGVRTPKRSVEQVILDAAHDFDAFHAQRTPAPWKQTGPILAAAVDGKGIPIVKQEGAQPVVRDKAAVFTEVAEQMERRDPEGNKNRVALILDLLHLLEKLWKAAYLFHAEGSLEAEQWVRRRALRILRGEASQVASYLYRNRDRTSYQEYLAQGLPIASGTVEGAYINLIKDRMERSGMRWTERMAEAIVNLTAIYPRPNQLNSSFGRLEPGNR